MARLDLLLVHPGHRMSVYQELGREISAVATPVWCAMTATAARLQGLSVDILDCEALGLEAGVAALRALSSNARVVAVVCYGHQPSASTQNMTFATAFARALHAARAKDYGPYLMLFGGHVAVLPERTLRESGCDAVATGEGALTVISIARGIRDAGFGRVPDVVDIAGLARLEPGGAYRPPRMRAEVMAHVPQLAYDLLFTDEARGAYRAHNHHAFTGPRAPYASIYASLGCPFRCSFCCIQAPFKDGVPASADGVNRYRTKDPQVVVSEVDALVEQHGVYTIRFDDEMFGANARWTRDLCQRLAARPYAKDLNLWAYARVDTARDDLLPLLRAAGFRWLCYGIESASEGVRGGVSKGGFDEAEVVKVVRAAEAAGIEVLANYMVGLPDDTPETVEQTLQLAIELNTAWANVYSCMPYVGSGLYDDVSKSAPEQLPQTWLGYSQHSFETTPLPTKTMSAAEVLRARDDFHRRYFERPEYLALVERKFGLAARAEVDKMNTVKLKRQLLGDAR